LFNKDDYLPRRFKQYMLKYNSDDPNRDQRNKSINVSPFKISRSESAVSNTYSYFSVISIFLGNIFELPLSVGTGIVNFRVPNIRSVIFLSFLKTAFNYN